jgi:hypothetical protein
LIHIKKVETCDVFGSNSVDVCKVIRPNNLSVHGMSERQVKGWGPQLSALKAQETVRDR